VIAVFGALSEAEPGDVIVCANDAFTRTAVIGDLAAGMMRNKGVAAFVTDGLVRDIEGLNGVGIPVCARGLCPNSPHKDGPGSIGLPITIGGVVVDSGDVVTGDENGIVIVAREAIDAVIAALPEVAAKEKKMDRMIADGARLPMGIAEMIREKGVRLLD